MRFIWMDIFVSQPYSGKLRSAERSPMYCLLLTVLTGNPIISPVSAGEEMPALQIPWTLGIICRSRAVSRAGNTLNGSAKRKQKAALHMKFQQAA